jgi:hypothetical protein
VEPVLQLLGVLVVVAFRYWRGRAALRRGFILSPSATLRVAGFARGAKSARPVLADGERVIG